MEVGTSRPNSKSPTAASHWPSLGHMITPGPIPAGGGQASSHPSFSCRVGWGLAQAEAGQSRCPSIPEWGVEAGQAHALATPTHRPEQSLELKRPPSEPLFWRTPVPLSSPLGPFPTFLHVPTMLPGACSRAGWSRPLHSLASGRQAGGSLVEGAPAHAVACSREPCGFLARTCLSERTLQLPNNLGRLAGPTSLHPLFLAF